MGKKSEHHEKRKYFRIEYPASIRPILKIRKHEFEVVDISEKGVRFSIKKDKKKVTLSVKNAKLLNSTYDKLFFKDKRIKKLTLGVTKIRCYFYLKP